MSEPEMKLLCLVACWYFISFSNTLNSQPVCYINGGNNEVCFGSSTTWSAPDGMNIYLWTGPSGFSALSQEISINNSGIYILTISDLNGTSSCSRELIVYPELSPGSINTTLRQFCAGGSTTIGGTWPPYGPATGGSGSYTYTWQLQEGCTGGWTDIPATNMTSYTPIAPVITTCYRRKVTDLVCNTESWTGFKRFEIFEDPVSQLIVPLPSSLTVCAGTFISATFTGGSGGFPGGTADIYEFSTNTGTSWSAYPVGQNIATAGLSGSEMVQIRTRRISTGVDGCNWGSYNTVAWSVNPVPVTSDIYHQ
jgi:hypothetical protein